MTLSNRSLVVGVIAVALFGAAAAVLFFGESVFAQDAGIRTGAVQGYKVAADGNVWDNDATIYVMDQDGRRVATDGGNPYNSGQIPAGTYTVMSTIPEGYTVSHSTDPNVPASSYVSGASKVVTIPAGGYVSLWFKYTPVAEHMGNGAVQGYLVEADGDVWEDSSAVISINKGVGSFRDNPYNSGQIPAGTYTVTSSVPEGYTVSHSTDPNVPASSYVPGRSKTVTVPAGGYVSLWFKYTPVEDSRVDNGAVQGYKVDQWGDPWNEANTTITVEGVGSFSGNPYNSGQIPAGTYTVTSSVPSGYSVSHSTDPGAGASSYRAGRSKTVTVPENGYASLWFKYTPTGEETEPTQPGKGVVQGYKVNGDGEVWDSGATIYLMQNGERVATLSDNPYSSGRVDAGSYVLRSTIPEGYAVSYSTDPGDAGSYVRGSSVPVTVTGDSIHDIWFKYTSDAPRATHGAVMGYKVEEDGDVWNAPSTITVEGVGTFSGNPYNSGLIPAGTYTVTSSVPEGYTVYHSTDPEVPADSYDEGASVEVTVEGGENLSLWFKYELTDPEDEVIYESIDGFLHLYAPFILGNKIWIGGWIDESNVEDYFAAIERGEDPTTLAGVDQIYMSELENGEWSELTLNFQKIGALANDPDIIVPNSANPDSLIMYYTALDNRKGTTLEDMLKHNTVAVATSANGGETWIDHGVIIDVSDGGDGNGAWSAGATLSPDGREIWLYYNTGSQEFDDGINYRQRFSLNGITKIGTPVRLSDFSASAGDYPPLSNIDVIRYKGTLVMTGNTLDLAKVHMYYSTDGLRWHDIPGLENPVVETENGEEFLLAPHLVLYSGDRYQIFYGLDDEKDGQIESGIIAETGPDRFPSQFREIAGTATAASLGLGSALTSSDFGSTSFGLGGATFDVPLYYGLENGDVSDLQQCLSGDPTLYPEGLVTGWFGSLTERAVVRFQDRYAGDVLFPAGVSEGTGYVGRFTINKLNDFCN